MKLSTKKLYGLIFLVFVVLHVVIFRDVLWHLPQLLSGQEVIVREELIPFFDFKSQFFDQIDGGYSDLTSSQEVRVSYSFLTSWMRYYQVLPFALILLNALSAFLLFYAFFIVAKAYCRKEPDKFSPAALFSFVAALVIHLILLYSKITHFYTLIAGFSLFAVALSFYLIEVFFRSSFSWKKIFLISLLVLINPAIHYHILFYVATALVSFIVLVQALRKGSSRAGQIKSALGMFLAIALLSGIPYGAFVLLTSGDDVTSSIPAIHYIIKGASIPLTHLFALDSSSQVDLFLHGVYIPLDIRSLKLVYPLLILFSLLLFRFFSKEQRNFTVLLVFVLLFSFWMSIGYTESFSFHELLRQIALFLDATNHGISLMLLKILYLFIEILRLPNRFQLIAFFVIGLLLTIGPLHILDWLKRIIPFRFAVYLAPALAVLLLLPFALMGDYRDTLLSGNFNGYIQPWTVSSDLVQVKQLLDQRRDGKLMVLPTLESGRIVGNDDETYNNFIDKFFIYYLNYPTLYYGTSSDIENKLTVQLLYRSLLYNQDWWNDVMVNISDLRYILVIKDISYRRVGQVYLPRFEKSLYTQIEKSPYLEKVYEGSQYDLFELKPRAVPVDTKMSLDLNWTNYLKVAIQSPRDFVQRVNLIPILLQNKPDRQDESILTDDPYRTVTDLFGLANPKKIIKPSPYLFPFDPSLLPSTIYTNTMPSMSALYGTNNFFQLPVPVIYQVFQGQFFALKPQANTINLPFRIVERNRYALLLRGTNAGTSVHIALRLRDSVLHEQNLSEKEVPAIVGSFTYEPVYDGVLEPGDYVLEINNTGQGLFFLDMLLPVSQDDLPFWFEDPSGKYSFRTQGRKYLFSSDSDNSQIPFNNITLLHTKVLSERKK